MCASWLNPEVELLEVKMPGCCRIKLDGEGDSYQGFSSRVIWPLGVVGESAACWSS